MTPLFARRREIELRCIHISSRCFSFWRFCLYLTRDMGTDDIPAMKLSLYWTAKTCHNISYLLQCPRCFAPKNFPCPQHFALKDFSAFSFSHDKTFLALGISRRLRLFARQDFPPSAFRRSANTMQSDAKSCNTSFNECYCDERRAKGWPNNQRATFGGAPFFI